MYHGEKFNSITHLIGAAISLVGVSVLMTLAVLTRDPWKITSCAIYGASMIFLFTFSTLYHSLQGRVKLFFQKMDHIAIYFLIIGTYAPFTLVSMPQEDGLYLFLAVMGLGVFGMSMEFLRKKVSEHRKLSLVIYLIMGWLVVLEINSLWRALSAEALTLLTIGGVFYTLGVVFYINDTRWRHAHGIWHLFVLAGSVFQYVSVLLVVIGS